MVKMKNFYPQMANLHFMLLYLQIWISAQNDDSIDEIYCYNVNSEYVEFNFLNELGKFIPQMCLHYMKLEIFHRKGLIDFETKLDEKYYKKLMWYRCQSLIYWIFNRIFPCGDDKKNAAEWKKKLEIPMIHVAENIEKSDDWIKFPEWISGMKYYDFLHIYISESLNCSEAGNRNTFEKLNGFKLCEIYHKDILNLLSKVNLKLNKVQFLSKFAIDNMSLYTDPLKNKIVTEGIINKTTEINFLHSSLYHNKEELILYMNKLLQTFSLSRKDPKIYFVCSSDLLIAEIIADNFAYDKEHA
ncbi:hypothetical protein EDEG_02423 [Edhazardia aedis USNM 41457]|uniref:Uncharacterized protein n=1 Tax=Edhazardia aedis (strain USNM 41457) TaxID=1003232 RepID=J8ZU66_EDHAE|nr:hypothetical protein EDEG_02423 [Edhazardia aedis USNM 41457]|eukprot:EJW03208.1 hypothetical protein EDEG_02423 [Edhazardia aedis USNM 41457]